MMTSNGARSPAAAWRLSLCLIVLSALAVRLYGLNWDHGADLHPDELFVAKIVLIDRIRLDWPPDFTNLLDPARSGLNPRSVDPVTGEYREFAYGALPLFVTDLAAWILSRLTGVNWNAMDHAYLVGRTLSALLSALTIVPVAYLGRRIGGPMVGLLAAFFAALAPMSIQLAHFFTTDSWLTFFVACALLASAVAASRGAVWHFALAGAAFGLAMASKGSVFSLVVPIVVAVFYNAARKWGDESHSRTAISAAVHLLAAGFSSLAAFAVFEPFALLRPAVYVQSLATQADIVSGKFDVPFTRVYAGTTPVLYQIEQLVRWGYGPVAGLLALAGMGLLAARAPRGEATALVLMSWSIPYCAVLIVADVKFLRYLEPLAPVLAIGAGLAVVRLRAALSTRPSLLLPARAAAPAILIGALAWTAAFTSIYSHENPRVAATKWIYAMIPPGSILTAEYWDDALPRALAYSLTPTSFGYGSVLLDLYRDLPPEEISSEIYDALSRADYIVQSSERVESAVHAAPWRYPAQGRFFDELENGNLGFQLAATFERRPSVLGRAIDDRGADESFINYDHPHVSIYRQIAEISRSSYDSVMSWALERPWHPFRTPPEPTLLLDTPVGDNPFVNDARWSAWLTSSTAGAVAVWLTLLVVLQIAGLPLARAVFSAFPDAGWGLARILVILVAAYPIWLGASLHVFRFRAIWAILGLVIVAAAGWVVVKRRLPESYHPGQSRSWLHAEAAFWIVFSIFLAFRLVVPDGWHPFWGGEKPMEFALINAIGRSAYFPSYDPWYADGYVNYYYYGFYLIAFLGKLTGIPAEIAFNLALPTMMGLLASSGYSVARSLAHGVTRSRRLGIAGGWVGVAVLTLAGNLSSARTLVEGVPDRFDPFIVWVWSGSRAIDNAITEFPFFTGLYADLHAHVVALPITLVAIALSMAIASASPPREHGREGIARLRASMLPLSLLALTIGSLGVTNAWDVPVYAALAMASLFMAAFGAGCNGRRIAWFVGAVAIVGCGAWLLFLPFHTHFVALFSQIAVVRDPTTLSQFLTHFGLFVVVCSVGLTVLLLPAFASRIGSAGPWLAIAAFGSGVFLFAIADDSWMSKLAELLAVTSLTGGPLIASWQRLGRLLRPGNAQQALGQILALLGAAGLVAGVYAQRPVLGLGFALGAASAVGWLMLNRFPERFVCLLTTAAFSVIAGAEIVVVADDLIDTAAYRMNTVFKFYNQVWVLLSIASAALIALMARNLLVHIRQADARPNAGGARTAWSRFGIAAASLLFLASLAYPAMAIGPRLSQRFDPGSERGTLNALSWMGQGIVPIIGSGEDAEISYRGDARAIQWLLDNVDGSPVIAEASIGPYRCNGSRISAATGLPTIIGWERHQQQQRYPEDLPHRVRDVRTLFTSADIVEKAAILNRYNVEFVIVGDLERIYPVANNECSPTGSPEGIESFDRMVGTSLDVAYADGSTTIYLVRGTDRGA